MTEEREKEIRRLVEWWPTYGDEGHDAVVDLLAEIDRLRASVDRLLETATEHINEAESLRGKLTKARAALDNYRYQHEKDLGMRCHCPPCLVADTTLKEIGDEQAQ